MVIRDRENGETGTLHLAAANGQIEVVRLLFKTTTGGAVLQDIDSRVALYMTVVKGQVEDFRRLLGETPQLITMRDPTGKTLLHLATMLGHTGIVSPLLEMAPSIASEVDGGGSTALHIAAGVPKDYVSIARLLLEKNPDGVKLKRKDGKTTLQLAARSGNTEVVRLFLEQDRGALDVRDKSTALSMAASAPVVTLLLDHGAEMQPNGNGKTALHRAAAAPAELMQALLEGLPADEALRQLARSDNAGHRPLDVAKENLRQAQRDQKPTVSAQKMVKLINDWLDERRSGMTRLHRAAIRGDINALTAALDAGADLSVKTDRYATPLQLAAGHGHRQVVIELLNRGANAAQTVGGRNALHWAEEANHPEVVKVLKEHALKERKPGN